MTDSRKALSKLSNIASNVASVAKQTFTLDMDVLDAAMDEAQIQNSIDTFFKSKNSDEVWEEMQANINTAMDCDHLKELIIKHFKEFIDQKILKSHFHSRNQKTKNINSLNIFYRHGISKIISKMMVDNDAIQSFLYDEIIKLMEKLEFDDFKETLIQQFGNDYNVESKPQNENENIQEEPEIMETIMEEKQEAEFITSNFVTQDMKYELFYELFKEDFAEIKQRLTQEHLASAGFKTIEELQEFYDKAEYKQTLKKDQKNKEELQKSTLTGFINKLNTKTTDKVERKKNKTAFISEDSNFTVI